MPTPAFWATVCVLLSIALVIAVMRRKPSQTPVSVREIVRYVPTPSEPPTDHTVRRKSPLTDPYAHASEASWITVVVDSRDRDPLRFPHPDHYEVQLSIPLNHVMRARLLSAEIPSTFHVFSKALENTTLRVQVGSETKNITIPDGNYDIDDMIRALQYYLQEAFQGVEFRVIADPITHGIGIETVSEPKTEFSVHVPDTLPGRTHWGLAYYLGFPRATIVHTVDGRMEASRPVVLNPETYMMLDIEEFGQVYEMGMSGGAIRSASHPFAKVPIRVSTFQYSFFDMPMGINEMNPPLLTLDKLRIRWRFHDGTPINFHEVDHSFTLELLCAANVTNIT